MGNKSSCKVFFQDGRGPVKEPFSGIEQRNYQNRIKLPPEMQALLDILRNDLKCSSQCIFPKKVQPHIPHAIGAVKSFGDGDISRGIDEVYNTLKESKSLSESIKYGKRIAFKTFIIVVVTTTLAILSWGFIVEIVRKAKGIG
jgi:hypothetical protein